MTIYDGPRLAQSAGAVKIAARLAETYLNTLDRRGVAAGPAALAGLARFRTGLPEGPTDANTVLRDLHEFGSPATTATAGGRFFGLVVGGSLPAALGARVLASAWDQVVFNQATSPVGVALEEVAAGWLLDLFDLPRNASVGVVTGTTMGTFLCLAAARHHLLQRQGWDVEGQGLWAAPALRVVASEEVHVTVRKALAMLGMGTARIEPVATDANGAMRPDEMPDLDDRTIVIAQAGNVNSGSVDPLAEICARARAAGAWVHVDGAFGLWGAASPGRRPLFDGLAGADSWVTDGHKWLNTPYDCGIAICRWPEAVHAAMATVAPYLKAGETAQPKDMVPEFSRSARGVEVWAALRSLGRSGVAELVDRCCDHAAYLADGLRAAGFEVLNEVLLNQVVATLPGHEGRMPAIAQAVQEGGEAWLGPTVWKGRTALRVSVSSWVTTRDDIDRLLAAITTETRKVTDAAE